MKFTTLLTIIIVGYVIYYAYQIIHDLFFTKGVLSDELHIEEEVDITGEVEKYQPVKVSREDIPLTKTNTEKDSTQDDGLTQMCGGYTIDELHNVLREEHDNPGKHSPERCDEALRIRPIPYGINMKNTESPL